MTGYEAFLLTVVTASTPLLLAACGELLTERSGILNLGVEGMMIMGAVAAFAAAQVFSNPYYGIFAAIVAGMGMALLFSILTLWFATNQVATGLALTLLGLGLSGMIGEQYIGQPGVRLEEAPIPLLSQLPVVGEVFFSQDVIVYISLLLPFFLIWFLFFTRWGLIIRATGDNHGSAHALGYSVLMVRFWCILAGGACSGLAGAYLSLVYTPQWVEGMTAGRGWIALALVVFATWRPLRILIGAYLFGSVSILQLYAQAEGLGIPSQFLSALPYIATIMVLVLISGNRSFIAVNTPASLGKPFIPDR